MIAFLSALLVAAGAPAPAAGSTPAAAAPVVRAEGDADEAPRPVTSAADATGLCTALTPAERLRTRGDAVARGEAEARQEDTREAALAARYEALVSAAKVAFAPFDGFEGRLALAEPALLPAAEGTLRLWPAEERGLPVEVDAARARRILDAQRANRLALRITFDLPEDATCSAAAKARVRQLAVEPVAWAWLDGDEVVATGGAAADRPLVSAAHGAHPKVDVGEPIAGPGEAKKAVATRVAELEACYAEALAHDPAVDGVLVVEMGLSRFAVAADSTGAPGLAACVQRALSTLPLAAGGARVAVPIRFELLQPAAKAGR